MRYYKLLHVPALLLALALGGTGCNLDDFERRRFPTESSEDPLPAALQLSTPGGTLTLPADGISSLSITAQVAASAVTPTRQVRFRTSSGSFAGAAPGTTEATVSFDGNGQAIAILRSSTSPGPVLVTAQVIDGMSVVTPISQIQLEFIVPGAEGLRFVEAPRRAPADGATTTRFIVEVAASQPLNDRSVTFTTSLGSFDGATSRMSTVNAGVDGQASVLLYSAADDGEGILAASLGTLYRIETLIRFEPAPAESILVEAPARIAQNGTGAVKVTLVRRVGTATNGTVVTLEAFDQTNTRFGNFHNVTQSGAGGVATAEFRPGGTGTPGPCRIEVKAAGSAATGRAEFELVPPPPPAGS